MPDLTELHRHLDICVRTSTLFELAQKQGIIPQATSLDSFKGELYITEPLSDLNAVLDQFTLFPKVQTRPEIAKRIAFEAVEDAYREGIRKIELRFSPGFVSHFGGLSWDEICDSYLAGLELAREAYPEIKTGLICIASRDFGPDGAAETVEFFLRRSDAFIGIDLAGPEKEFPCRIFKQAFEPAIRAGSNITIHAGEASGPENIWQAIEDLKAKRIGHGITSIEDQELIDFLRDQEICLEVCPSSNILTKSAASFESHPLAALVRAGVPCSINTDDPGIFPITLPGEIELASTRMGLNSAQINFCLDSASKYSFL